MSRDPRRIAAVAVMALGLSLSACGQAATGESAGTAPASTSTVQVASTATTSMTRCWRGRSSAHGCRRASRSR